MLKRNVSVVTTSKSRSDRIFANTHQAFIMMEICEHSVLANGVKVTVSLEGYHKGDAYGTNLELTGLGNWFGSLNMCNMMGDNSALLFGSDNNIARECGAINTAGSADTQQDNNNNNFCMLELGSGLGRAGLMAMKLIELEALRNRSIDNGTINNTTDLQGQSIEALHVQPKWRCVLTDGEDEIVTLLVNNYARNITNQQSNTDIACNATDGSSCQQLWWGPNAELADMQQRFPSGFDLIIGADLIYGRDAVPEPEMAVKEVVIDDLTSVADQADDTVNGPAHEQSVAASVSATAVGGFCRDKLRQLLHTVCALLSMRGSSLDTNGDSVTSSIFDVQHRPAFFLAVTRREFLPMEELSALALSVGLRVNMLDDYTFDIFDTNVDSESLFWRDTILSFTRV